MYVMGICSSNGMVLYNITKEAFVWGRKANVKVDLETFPPEHCLEARWKTDETSSLLFLVKTTFHIIVSKHLLYRFKRFLLLVPPLWNYNPDVPNHSDHMQYCLLFQVFRVSRRLGGSIRGRGSIGMHKSKRKYWY
ncbi:hypothetical protein F2Q70_00019793 [Brassica cretica]|uniref:Uncharacterized protein n=1 Tax=Brassica cretica TaxID=69181 RepID=A0A8S9GVQ5_BRACR|nr:hypothetical protein F2Q70_00019793 [Brassica cretica]